MSVQSVLNIASNEVGYDRFQDPEEGTKYGRWYEQEIDGPGGYDYGASGVAYCAMFVSWVLNRAGVSCAGFPGAYCPVIHTKQHLSKHELRAGDVVLFDWENDETDDHVGIVEYVSSDGVHTIEGNTNNGKVMRRTRALSTICGGIRPNYGSEQAQSASNRVSSQPTQFCDVKLPLLRYGSGLNDPNGSVLALQKLLKSSGFPCACDGEFGSETQRQLKAYQRSVGLEDDGECFTLTWNKLLK